MKIFLTLSIQWNCRGVVVGLAVFARGDVARREIYLTLKPHACPTISAGADGCVMQWRKINEPDIIDSGDEAQRSGEDSELEADGGIRCCVVPSSRSLDTDKDHSQAAEGEDGLGRREGDGEAEGVVGGRLGGGRAKLPWVSAMVPPSNIKVGAIGCHRRGIVLQRRVPLPTIFDVETRPIRCPRVLWTMRCRASL